jgi:hypothetical protein
MLEEVNILTGILQGLAVELPLIKPLLLTVGNTYTAFVNANGALCSAVSNYLACAQQVCRSSKSDPADTDDTSDQSESDLQQVFALDPNDKDGNKGVQGAQRYVSGSGPLYYSIYYDNQPTASAPAQAVKITDILNSSLDLATLTLGPITILDHVVTPPSFPLSIAPFTTTIDLRPTVNLLVKVSASLDIPARILTWALQSLDPTTSQPPTDPLAGFLPPGAEGSAFYSVMPKSVVTTGTMIDNTAASGFDLNETTNTPTWSNTIDNTQPTSQVVALPPFETSLRASQFNGQVATSEPASRTSQSMSRIMAGYLRPFRPTREQHQRLLPDRLATPTPFTVSRESADRGSSSLWPRRSACAYAILTLAYYLPWRNGQLLPGTWPARPSRPSRSHRS